MNSIVNMTLGCIAATAIGFTSVLMAMPTLDAPATMEPVAVVQVIPEVQQFAAPDMNSSYMREVEQNMANLAYNYCPLADTMTGEARRKIRGLYKCSARGY